LPTLSDNVQLKTEFESAEYINQIKSDKLVELVAPFRLSSHTIALENGRYPGEDREDRSCEHCIMQFVESEYYFLLICTHYSEIFAKHIMAIPT
jgi:hypothetical protein